MRDPICYWGEVRYKDKKKNYVSHEHHAIEEDLNCYSKHIFSLYLAITDLPNFCSLGRNYECIN